MGSDNSFPRKFDFSYPNPCEIFSKNTTSIFKFWILSLLSSWLHQTICSWKSKIASDRFITMSGKVITDRPIVTQEEKLNSSRRISLATEHSFMEAVISGWSLYDPRVVPPLVHPPSSDHVGSSTGASNLPVFPGPATSLCQVLNHQFKLWPSSSLS